MKFKIKASRSEIERNFNKIKAQINNYVLKEDFQLPPNSLFKRLDDEYKKVEEKYIQYNDQINLLHVQHNYLWSKSFEYLYRDPTQSLSLIIQAIRKLLDRHRLSPYSPLAFEKMWGAYEVALIKISKQGQLINFDMIEKELLDFVETYCSPSPIKSEKFKCINNLIISLLLIQQRERVDDLKITYSNLSQSDRLAEGIKNLSVAIHNNVTIDKSHLSTLSQCYEVLYRIRKKQLQSLAEFVFFEKSEKKRSHVLNIIDKIAEEMVESSTKSFKYAKKFCEKLPLEKQDTNEIKTMITLKELDKLTAKYYQEAYSKKDILKAWTVMDGIKRFLVKKAFKENVPLSDSLLTYYGEEWSLLYIFAKICLLKEEINKRASSLTQNWEREMFTNIAELLNSAEKLFKYEMSDKKDYVLKIMTSSFAGHFSEYFIHELCREFFDYGKFDEHTPPEFKDLLECVKLASNKDEIVLNDILKQGEPDIDIHIKNKCGIFFKNRKIEADEMRKIWKEVELCQTKKINKIFYAINFIKNIEQIEYIRLCPIISVKRLLLDKRATIPPR